jgi:acetyl-CoA acyltransferase
MAGAYDVVIAAGVEVMSLVPMGASIGSGIGFPFGEKAMARYADDEYIPGHKGLVGQGISAEIIANEWGLSRDDLDAFGARSQARAEAAANEGRFDNEIVAVTSKVRDKETGEVKVLDDVQVTRDEGIRPGTTTETLAKLKPAFLPDGKVTAGNSSQITDGASAMLIMSEEKASQLGLTPRARFHTFALAGVDPVHMLTGPMPSTQKAFEKSGLTVDDIDLFEVNEAFASVVLAWLHDIKADPAKVNVNGGAIALGHPLGCSGTKLMATLLNELERTGGRYGLQTMCEGGGLANATIIERL